MEWERPSFVEIKMDSEINSYQDEFQESPDVEQTVKERQAAAPAGYDR